MQLLLFCDRNNRLFLYDRSLCDSMDGRFIPRDESVRAMLKDIGVAPSPITDPYMHQFVLLGTCFSNAVFINSNKLHNEVVILRGNNVHGEEVHLSLSLAKGEFDSFMMRKESTPCFFIDENNCLAKGATHGRSNKQLFADVKATLKDITPSKPNPKSEVVPFKFFNKEGRIVDTVLCLCEVLTAHSGRKIVTLK
ncbi:hypothetical protein DRF75_00950 [Ehrlichia minasensis]|uniref:Uncharacterized protein n=1 Tax=Ehrlichia minasensis TaxID=1242993 RepID=A0A4Q6I8Q9_9RICK|nr:hypothetical protein [Ehrlichia minasensis]RZB13039.1 hypothetical protein DRF75_00950 [Ehrlichia minasensis]